MRHQKPDARRAVSDLCELARSAQSRYELHDGWLDLLAPFGFDRAIVMDDTVAPGPLTAFATRNQRELSFEDARKDSLRYLADYPVLRARAAASADVIQLTPKDRWLRVYQEHGVPYGQRQLLMLALHAHGRPLCVVTMSRDTPTSQAFHARLHELAAELAPIMSVSDLQFTQPARAEPECFSLLGARELEVARLVRRGLTNREIGQLLSSSHNTVRNQLAAVFRKLAVSTRAELAGLR